jgi:hypothetical protein
MDMEQPRMKTFVPRDDRRPVNLAAFALSPTRDCDVTVSDLSYNGCQIESGEAFQSGEILELRVVKRGAINVEVRWAAEGRAGAQFLN